MVTRREFIKKAGYTAPVVLTLNATPAFAGTGSNRPGGDNDKRGKRARRNRYRRYRRWLRRRRRTRRGQNGSG